MPAEPVQMTVDGEPVSAKRGETLLAVCKRMGKEIPTLCHHEALKPCAACRVCLVELQSDGQSELVPSCQYPVEDGLTIVTNSKQVKEYRKVVLGLLLARCPGSKAIRELAQKHGVKTAPYPSDHPEETCILCGLCVRVCEELIGAAAIGFFQRGVERKVGPPFEESTAVCIGCQACISVCPTGHVRSVIEEATLRMETWKTDLELAECEECGRKYATVKHLDHVREKLPEAVPLPRICDVCRRAATVKRLSKIGNAVRNLNEKAV